EGAVDYAALMREEGSALRVNSLDASAACSALYRVINHPTAEEASVVGAMQHGDGMGSSASRSFAAFSGGTFTADKILNDYHRAYWKAGMLNQQTAESMMLRTLLWLHAG
ncbi:MAG: hypothetical protein ABI120_00170, partial [Gemmatimonadaceae bacterium]